VKLLRTFATGCGLATLFFLAAQAYCAPARYGQLTGVVLDPLGQPQLGASVSIDPEGIASRDANQQITTDEHGSFSLARLRPGLYAVKVTQAGFLPSMQQHVRVGAGLTTLIRIEMDSVFASLDRLRRQPSQSTQADDWKWVLRTSSATRPVLQFADGTVLVASGESSNLDGAHQLNGRIELTSGSREPGSPSALSGSPATAVSYDQSLGGIGQVLVAGQMSYDPTGAAGVAFASVWLPSGQFDRGSETTVIVRQSGFGPNQQVTREMRAEHSGQVVLGDRVTLDYGAAYVAAGIGEVSATVRPRAGLNFRLPSGWSSSLFLESEPGAYGLRERGPILDSTLDTLDTLPILIDRNNGYAVADNWHEELAVKRDVRAHGRIEAASYHDYSRHTAVFGYDGIAGQGPIPVVYAHDGGTESSWGVRLAYRQKLAANMDVAAVYAWAGALAPDDLASGQLSDALHTVNRHSVAVRVSGKVPRAKTQIAASYKFIDGTVVSRQDLFGEAALGLDPNLSLAIQQPLPSFGSVGRHWEAIADFRNLLAQGYVPVNNQGQVVLIPVLRSFRGGVNFQF
jgi:hypothetical protein